MENQQWTAKYQQSVPTGLERTESLNNGNTDHCVEDTESSKNAGKDEPENRLKGIKPNLDSNPANVIISEKAKQTIRVILEQIKSLSQIEKFLLFLKLPSEVSNAVDPFRQPLNPLGSRSEIYRTISWIKTHLEEDPDISLPKQEVYNEYYNYCEKNSIKPLSQADFGKVMKQVYPKVRARRLGTRGNSRYCYSGLRRCVKLKAPVLPDLADKPMSTEAPFTQSSLMSAAWLIVKNWSEQQLGTQFSSLQALAYYLILNHSIGTGTEAAIKITSAAESSIKVEDNGGKVGNKHREMQLQLQRKIQQKNEGKERKRKLQSPKSEQKASGKKVRSQSAPAPPAIPLTSPTVQLSTNIASSECSTTSSSSTSPTQGKPICDKSLDFTQLSALPDFKSFQKPATDGVLGNSGQETNVGASTNKVAIPRLQPPPVQMTTPPKKQPKPAKYKSIQPRLQHCDIAPYNPQPQSQAAEENRSQDLHNIDRIKECKSSDDDCDVPDFPLTRERLNSVSNVEKDAMDEYLGTNNSQHEEELSKYFSNNNTSETVDSENTTKLSTLRQLLEQNGIAESKSSIQNVLENTVIPDRLSYPSTSLNPTPVQITTYITPISHQGALPGISTNVKRRVSFETPAPEESVPPSPNTRRKNFSFTPISPGPQSPNGIQSKCSSTNASPFVSPRSTPILRTKNSTHQNIGIVKSETRKLKIKKELDLSLEIPTESQFASSNYMPMSAPASPMLNNKSVLQKLLNSSSKVSYNPGYANAQIPVQADVSQEVSQLLASNIQPNLDSYRSQSVPIHHMVSVKTFPSNGSFIPEQVAPTGDFSEIDPIPESESDNVKRILHSLDEQTCDNNNIELFNIELTNNSPCLPEFGLPLINNNLEINGFPQNNLPFNNITTEIPATRSVRSQSIDVNMTFDNKCNPSRSVPSTPLSFVHNLKPQIKSNYSHNSRSYPSTPMNSEGAFTYNINGDCLLNGQPIRTDNMTENMEFMQNFDINGDNNIEQLPHEKSFNMEGHDFTIVENDPTLMDDNCVLLQQNYSGNIN